MKIEKIRWDDVTNSVAITIEGREGIELCFDIKTVKDKDDLKSKIKAKLQKIDKTLPSVIATEPAIVSILKELEGTEIG